MAVKIRMSRMGRRHRPFFRIKIMNFPRHPLYLVSVRHSRYTMPNEQDQFLQGGCLFDCVQVVQDLRCLRFKYRLKYRPFTLFEMVIERRLGTTDLIRNLPHGSRLIPFFHE